MLPFKDLCYVKRHNYYLVIPMLIMLIFSVALVINRPLFRISSVLTEDKRFILVIIFLCGCKWDQTTCLLSDIKFIVCVIIVSV